MCLYVRASVVNRLSLKQTMEKLKSTSSYECFSLCILFKDEKHIVVASNFHKKTCFSLSNNKTQGHCNGLWNGHLSRLLVHKLCYVAASRDAADPNILQMHTLQSDTQCSLPRSHAELMNVFFVCLYSKCADYWINPSRLEYLK